MHEMTLSPSLARLGYWRYGPTPIEDRWVVFVRPVHAQHQIEFAVWSRQPVRFLLCARRVFLDIDIDRSVRVRLQVLPRADRIAIDRVCDKEILLVVHCYRPEAFHGRGMAF